MRQRAEDQKRIEHVRSPRLLVRAIQRALEPFTVWLGGDTGLERNPLLLNAI